MMTVTLDEMAKRKPPHVLDGLSLDDFVQFARDARLSVLATTSRSEQPEAALMEMAVAESGELVFDTHTNTRKLANIRSHARVAVVIGWTTGVSIQVEGHARIVTGNERVRYEELHTAQWPGSRVSNPELEVIVVAPTWAHRYDTKSQPACEQYADWLPEAL